MTVAQTVQLAASVAEMVCHKCEIKECYYTSQEAYDNGWNYYIVEGHARDFCPHCLEKM